MINIPAKNIIEQTKDETTTVQELVLNLIDSKDAVPIIDILLADKITYQHRLYLVKNHLKDTNNPTYTKIMVNWALFIANKITSVLSNMQFAAVEFLLKQHILSELSTANKYLEGEVSVDLKKMQDVLMNLRFSDTFENKRNVSHVIMAAHYAIEAVIRFIAGNTAGVISSASYTAREAIWANGETTDTTDTPFKNELLSDLAKLFQK